jgi:hypothetical protein
MFLFVLSLCHYVLKTKVYVAFGIAGILSCLVNLSYSKIESYSNKGDKEEVEEEEGSESESESNGDEEEDKDSKPLNDNPINMEETIKGALQNFDPKTLKNMTKDTTSLIKSQSELMNMIQQMQPVISKGLSLVDKFHGQGKTEKLFKQYDNLRKLQKSIKIDV